MKNLLKDSEAYYNNNYFYEIFSIAEDSENKVANFLAKIAKNKIVLDAGCGTGKFLPILESNASKYIGIDLSNEQLKIAKEKSNKKSTEFFCTNLINLPLENNSIDLIISSWVLGTITNLAERTKVLHELQRILSSNGNIILIENAENSEFESIRGRDKDTRTKDYNNWILSNGFELEKTINTFFEFSSFEEAKKCFNIIYGNAVSTKIKSKIIEHKINIYKFTNKTNKSYK